MTTRTLTPPAHICGPLQCGTDLSIRHDRWRWVAEAAADGHTFSEIGRALGIERATSNGILKRGDPCRPTEPRASASKPEPVAAAHISQSYGGKYHAVTVARAPWDTDTQGPDPRPETAPRSGIVSPRHRMTAEQVIDTIRRECIRARAEA